MSLPAISTVDEFYALSGGLEKSLREGLEKGNIAQVMTENMGTVKRIAACTSTEMFRLETEKPRNHFLLRFLYIYGKAHRLGHHRSQEFLNKTKELARLADELKDRAKKTGETGIDGEGTRKAQNGGEENKIEDKEATRNKEEAVGVNSEVGTGTADNHLSKQQQEKSQNQVGDREARGKKNTEKFRPANRETWGARPANDESMAGLPATTRGVRPANDESTVGLPATTTRGTRPANDKSIAGLPATVSKDAEEIRRAKDREDLRQVQELEKRAREKEQKRRAEEERKAKERRDEEKRVREDGKRKAKEEEERKAREERRKRMEGERRAREEERRTREEEERRAREKEERRAREKEERKAREEEERRVREKEERRAREKEERRVRAKEEKRSREIQQKKAREVKERQTREAEERKKREAQRAQEEQESLARKESARASEVQDRHSKDSAVILPSLLSKVIRTYNSGGQVKRPAPTRSESVDAGNSTNTTRPAKKRRVEELATLPKSTVFAGIEQQDENTDGSSSDAYTPPAESSNKTGKTKSSKTDPKPKTSSKRRPPRATRYVHLQPCMQCMDHGRPCRVTYQTKACYYCGKHRVKCEGGGEELKVRHVSDNESVIEEVAMERAPPRKKESKRGRSTSKTVKSKATVKSDSDADDGDESSADSDNDNKVTLPSKAWKKHKKAVSKLETKKPATSDLNQSWETFERDHLRRKGNPILPPRPAHINQWEEIAKERTDSTNHPAQSDIEARYEMLQRRVDKMERIMQKYEEYFKNIDHGQDWIAAKLAFYSSHVEVVDGKFNILDHFNELITMRINGIEDQMDRMVVDLYQSADENDDEEARGGKGVGAGKGKGVVEGPGAGDSMGERNRDSMGERNRGQHAESTGERNRGQYAESTGEQNDESRDQEHSKTVLQSEELPGEESFTKQSKGEVVSMNGTTAEPGEYSKMVGIESAYIPPHSADKLAASTAVWSGGSYDQPIDLETSPAENLAESSTKAVLAPTENNASPDTKAVETHPKEPDNHNMDTQEISTNTGPREMDAKRRASREAVEIPNADRGEEPTKLTEDGEYEHGELHAEHGAEKIAEIIPTSLIFNITPPTPFGSQENQVQPEELALPVTRTLQAKITLEMIPMPDEDFNMSNLPENNSANSHLAVPLPLQVLSQLPDPCRSPRLATRDPSPLANQGVTPNHRRSRSRSVAVVLPKTSPKLPHAASHLAPLAEKDMHMKD